VAFWLNLDVIETVAYLLLKGKGIRNQIARWLRRSQMFIDRSVESPHCAPEERNVSGDE
jgi:hypothetical protein